uniref:Uncharacterized protein n=1 Tax=Micrurus lemniscatus lemniscatus TaxID=129467 RepID=A0A2D4IKU9_MICLE
MKKIICVYEVITNTISVHLGIQKHFFLSYSKYDKALLSSQNLKESSNKTFVNCLSLACFSFQSALPIYRNVHLQYLLSRTTRHCDRVRESFQMAEYMRKHQLQNKG